MAERLDEERLEILRSWGAGLATDEREELRAAGKAITILIDEIERLHVDLWHARRPVQAPAGEGGTESAADTRGIASSHALAASLRARLAAVDPRRLHDREG